MKRVPLATALLTTIAFFHRALFTDGIFNARDLQRVYYPLKEYWAARIRAGALPEWYPYDGLGQSFVGMVISAPFHPLNALGLVLGLEAAVTASVVLSFLAAWLGVFALARRFVTTDGPAVFAAIAFAFSGYLVGITNNLLYLVGAATVPWALWAFDRLFEAPSPGRVAPAAALLALVLFSGDAQSFAVTGALALLLGVMRHQPGRAGPEAMAAGGALGLGGLLGAAQLLPALATLPESMIAGQPMGAVLKWSMHPLRLFELPLGPIFARDPNAPITGEIPRMLGVGSDELWVESLYVGLPVLVLAGAAVLVHRRDRRVRLGVGALALFVALALGKHVGLYGLLHDLLPGWRNFRYPEKLFPFIGLGLALLSAAGLEAIDRDPVKRWRAAMAVAASGALAIGAGLLVAQARGPALQSGAIAIVFAAALLAIQKDTLRAALLPAIAFVMLFVANEPIYGLTSNAALRTPPPFFAELTRREGPARLGSARVFGAAEVCAVPKRDDATYSDLFAAATAGAFEAVTPAHFGREGGNAYLPATSRRVRELADLVPTCPSCARALGVRYLAVTSALRPLSPALAQGELARAPKFRQHLVGLEGTPPRAFIADKKCATAAEALAAVRADGFDPLTGTRAECADADPPAAEGSAGAVEVVAYEAERVELKATAARPAWVVLADAYAPGWEARVDDQPAAILRANYAVRAVEVPAGAHRVVFTYRTPLLRLGALLSALGMVLGVGLALWGRRR